ncbi:hypothetical protein V490_04807 [Pseudogymnoascus sp. VKM F-3557]|nr:hypothetical protein V490_04807 [Pseudogymnoascus sp. VKM F-3557]
MDIIPIPLIDQQKPIASIRTRTYFVLNDLLDEEILRKSLDTLIREHWQKLGARFKARRKDGRLEYHLPPTFDDNYELFNWTSKQYDHSIEKVPSFPRPTAPEKGIALLPHIHTVEEWFKPADWPLECERDELDRPLIYAQVSLFVDATVIALSLPHVFSDQLGLANIIKAWIGIIGGVTPPPMVGFKDDVFATMKDYADYPPQDVRRKGRMAVRKWGEYPLVILGFLPELIRDRAEDAYTVFLPAPLVESLRERHGKELAEKYGENIDITNGDIVSGILLKFTRMGYASPKMLSFSQSVNMRGRIPELDQNRDGFVHNALAYSTARFPMCRSTLLSEIVYHNRKAIIEAADPKDISIGVAITQEMVRRGQGTHIVRPFESSYFVTNWSAAWRGLDFSPAVKEDEKERDASAALKAFVFGDSGVASNPQRFNSTVMSKTDEGYWCSFSMSKKASKLVEECLAKDPMLADF